MSKIIFSSLFIAALSACVSVPKQEPPPRASGCNFSSGYSDGILAIAYDNSCTKEQEELYLTGYAIGRKTRWVKNSLQDTQRLLACIENEREVKFSRTPSPVVIDPGSEHSSITQKMKETDCPSDLVRSRWGIDKEIVLYHHRVEELELKFEHLQKLQNEISVHPSDSAKALNDYEKDGLDPLDINLRWGKYIEQKGGVDKLSEDERTLLFHDLRTTPELPDNVVRGALYGFGIGHARQGRYASVGWIYTVIDTLVVGAMIYGASTKQFVGITAPGIVFGVPLSRLAQYLGVYQYNFNHSQEVKDLRTQL